MTPKHKAHLQWFYDRGAALKQLSEPGAPSAWWLSRLESAGQIELTSEGWTLTDKGRRDLHEGETS